MKHKKFLGWGLSVAVLLVLAVWLYWSNVSIQTDNYNIQAENLPESFEGYTIVQVSDLHNRLFGEGQSVLLGRISEQNPDIIVVTGDLIDRNRTDVAIALEFIEGAVKIAPVYYVTGNHEELCNKSDELYEGLTAAGAVILNNESTELTKSGEKIMLYGLSDPMGYDNTEKTKEAQMRELLDKFEISDDNYNILLSHRPEYIDVYAEYGLDLAFCGHTHGGQIRLPIIGAVYAPNQGLFPKYDSGLFYENGMYEIISRGLGNSGIQFRVLCRPDMVVCRLTGEKG